MLQLFHCPVVACHAATVQVALLSQCAGNLCMCHLQGIQVGQTVLMNNLQAKSVQAMALHIGKAAHGSHYRTTVIITMLRLFCQSTHCVTKAVWRRRGSNPSPTEVQPALRTQGQKLQVVAVSESAEIYWPQVASSVSSSTVSAHKA